MGNLNIEVLLEAAGKKLGVSPEALRGSLSGGNISEITDRLSREDREKINRVLNDPALSEKFRSRYMNGQKRQ